MSKTHYPVSGDTDPGRRLKSIETRLIAAWNDLQTERAIIIQKKDLAGNSGVKTVTNAVTSGGLIKLTVTSHGYSTGTKIIAYGINGTVEANGPWPITVVDANSFTLDGSVFVSTYTSGGETQLTSVYATIGEDYFLGANADAKSFNAGRGFAELDSAYGVGDAAIRQMIGRTL